MVNKCSVGGCKTNYVGHDTDAVFSFPKDPDLFGRWKRFCNRLNWEPTMAYYITGLLTVRTGGEHRMI